MEETKWSDEQLEAITEKDCNLLVAAAAGAGKTAVLVERIIRKITCEENPVDIDRLLIVTFTNAAATEMRERIADAISKALDENPGSKLLQRQLALLNKANITTIHSFCLEVIKNNFHYIGLNPGFRIADETEALLIKMETLDDLFEEIYEQEKLKEEFFELLECYGGNRDDQSLKDLVFSLYEFIHSFPWPEDWLKGKTEYFNLSPGEDFAKTRWGELLLKNAAIELESLKAMMEKALSIIETSEGLDPYLPNFREEITGIDSLVKLCRDTTWDSIYNAFSSFEFKRLPNCKKDVDKSAQEHVKSVRNEVKDRISKLKSNIFAASSNEVIEELNRLYPLLKYLSELVIEFDRKYTEKKRERSVLDFNDLEHFCLDILTERKENGGFSPSSVAMEYKERFEEILVDEYQDSNLVQEIILNVVSRKDLGTPNIFMVGDVKQSIYRFRQARPELFLEKYNTYSREKREKYRKIQLYKNFRSRKEVIDSVNFIFSRIMSEYVGELDYNEEEALNPGAVYEDPEEEKQFEETMGKVIVGGPTELHIIEAEARREAGEGEGRKEVDTGEEIKYGEEDGGENGVEYKGDEEDESLDIIQCEARIVAKRIKELVGEKKHCNESENTGDIFKVYDKQKKKYRPIEYRDIVILLRSTRNWADVFVEELAAQGIPVYADTGTGFFKTVEVQIMLSLLQIIDNPLQDIPLLAVLRSPIVLFTPDELADIRLADKEAPLYEALKKIARVDDDDAEQKEEKGIKKEKEKEAEIHFNKKLVEKTAQFLKTLEKWRDKALYMSTDELIWYLYTETGFYSYAGAMPGGEQRQANLRMLFEQARKFEETSYKGLFNFINFINKLRSGRGDMGSAKILGENENVVRIMSIHKSKGLEFPVVILSGCGKGFNFQDMNKSIILHQELGFGPDYVDVEKRIAYPTLAKQALRYQIKAESLSEEMRILYVGFTRAREKLILTGAVKDLNKSILRWREYASTDGKKIPAYIILKGKHYLDWICPALMIDKGQCKGNGFHIVNTDAGTDTDKGDGSHVSLVLNKDDAELNMNGSLWDIRLWHKGDIIKGDEQEKQTNNEFLESIEKIKAGTTTIDKGQSMYYDEIKRRLDWEYKYSDASRIPIKVSVTELKRRFAFESSEEYPAFSVYTPTLIKKPAFLEESRGLNAAQVGTAMHFVMQHLDLTMVKDIEQIKSQVDGMVEKELLTEQQAKAIDIRKIYRFFNSTLGKRMLDSVKIYREVPFNIQISSSELFTHLKGSFYDDETVLLQGVVDCFFEENDGLVLLDYKTDYIQSGAGQNAIIRIKDQYKMQIQYYTMVLEKLLQKKVKEKYIYLFWNGEIIEC
ncbi:MAG: helicase-exonuclease AddAB subunit AddA [Firmicutes bacterium]|nr:helicase-exonuclease AddAB subunit AddA [Bacillota bacterium]